MNVGIGKESPVYREHGGEIEDPRRGGGGSALGFSPVDVLRGALMDRDDSLVDLFDEISSGEPLALQNPLQIEEDEGKKLAESSW